ncbi:MAG: phosphate ABC transporter substrate-binding protein PstS [Solirubrobacteraceae bacterium]
MTRDRKRRLRAIGLSGASAVAALAVTACGGGGTTLVGAGSTLVAPLVSVWQPRYLARHGVAVTYGAIGSGAGIVQLTARTVDFGASDAPLTPAQATACGRCLEIPWALSGIVVAYHVDGVPDGLKFTGPLLAQIWMGEVKRWNDPAIRTLNPGVTLPATPIVPVHRTDGCGDTFAFTDYLSKVSPRFQTAIGRATAVAWSGGLGGQGNSGVGGVLSSTNGAIAYLAIAYAKAGRFHIGLVRNAAARYPEPGVPSIAAAAAARRSVPSGGKQGISLTDPRSSATAAYPISTFSYVLARATAPAPLARSLRAFIDWALTKGQSDAARLQFAPLPSRVVAVATADTRLIGG